MKMARQGDVLLIRVAMIQAAIEIPRDTQNRIVLAHGEVTGHAHAIHDETAELFRGRAANTGVFLQVVNRVELRHEEHTTVRVPKGAYRVLRQTEYSPGELRQVAD
jgi:hypothetical protein